MKSIQALALGNGATIVFAVGMDNQLYGQRFNALGDLDGGYFITNSGAIGQ